MLRLAFDQVAVLLLLTCHAMRVASPCVSQHISCRPSRNDKLCHLLVMSWTPAAPDSNDNHNLGRYSFGCEFEVMRLC
jgi:hypothetical protein